MWSSPTAQRSEEHTSELQSRLHLVCRLLLEKKKKPVTRGFRALYPRSTPPALSSPPRPLRRPAQTNSRDRPASAHPHHEVHYGLRASYAQRSRVVPAACSWPLCTTLTGGGSRSEEARQC